MKKSLMSLLALGLAGTLVSCSKDTGPDSGNQEVGTLQTKITFAEAPDSKVAGQTTAVPLTSWDNVTHVQLFLYDANGAVKYSDVMANITNTNRTLTWTDVPTGTYTLAIVANSNGNVETSVDGSTPTVWDKFNVREKSVTADNGLYIAHAPTTFPTGLELTGKDAKLEPAEIFTGYSSAPVEITSGNTVDLTGSPIALNRDMALMRVRVDKGDASNDALDFTHATASIMIHRLPAGMKIAQGNAGGITAGTSQEADVMVVASGGTTFSTQAPTDGYENGGTMLAGGFDMWRDIVVFPNNAGRANAATNVLAAPADAYYIVLSAFAPAGYVLADGTTVGVGGQTVYWDGLIRDAFVPNNIREVNITLKSGGSITQPEEPTEEGSLNVKVGAPVAWNSAIEQTEIEL